MLSSLVYGPHNLQLRPDPKNSKRKIIDKDKGLTGFKIGHQQISQTFFPDFVQEEKTDIYFGDIAGLHDTKGPMIELLHIFMNKLILNRACFVRFIVPITRAQIEMTKGVEVINQLKIIQSMISQDYNELGKSIQPVLTKCDPADSEFDIDILRNNLMQQLQNYVTNLETQSQHQMDQHLMPCDNEEDQQNEKL